MRRRINLVAIVSALLAGANAIEATSEHNREYLSNFAAIAFSEVKSISVAQVYDTNGPILNAGEAAPKPVTIGDYHGYPLISKWRQVDDQSQKELARLLKRPIDFWVKTYAEAGDKDVLVNVSFCMPDYGYAMHLETNEGPRDFLICLQCGQIAAFAGNHRADFDLKDSDLVRLKAFYLDEFILLTGVKRTK
jgi:hypothetical protein